MSDETPEIEPEETPEVGPEERKRRLRRRRGKTADSEAAPSSEAATSSEAEGLSETTRASDADATPHEPVDAEREEKPRRGRAARPEPAADVDPQPEEKPRRTRRRAAKPEAAKPEPETPDAEKPEPETPEAEKPEATKPEAEKPEPAKPARSAKPTRPAPSRRRAQREPGTPIPVVRAQAKYVRSSPRKARLVCDHIRGKTVEEARAILAHTPRAIARDWSKLLESAVANAEHNHELVGEDLYVKAVTADDGPTIKRFRPRAMGRATPIRKRTSHLTISLTPKD